METACRFFYAPSPLPDNCDPVLPSEREIKVRQPFQADMQQLNLRLKSLTYFRHEWVARSLAVWSASRPVNRSIHRKTGRRSPYYYERLSH